LYVTPEKVFEKLAFYSYWLQKSWYNYNRGIILQHYNLETQNKKKKQKY